MDRWKRAETYLGFESLDHGWERVIVYGAAAAFWVNLAAWLITRDGIVPGIDAPLEWLVLAFLALPGTAKAAFPDRPGPESARGNGPRSGRIPNRNPQQHEGRRQHRHPDQRQHLWMLRPPKGRRPPGPGGGGNSGCG